jgi:hypothetical protein
MRLPIETWVAETPLPDESLVAFNESVVAYKAGANRAALLFSCVAWGLALRERLLNTPDPPNGMPVGQWQKLLQDLRNEDRWDAQVFDCTQMKTPVTLFHVSDDIRTQVRYWKDRRNDCAHFKLNEINPAHVESFWAFVRSNLGRFVPLGSEADLIAAILRHFDTNVTPPNTDLSPLVARIPQSMGPERFKPFLVDAKNALSTKVGTFLLARSTEYHVLLATCLSAGDRLGKAALELMLEDRSALVGILRMWPEAAGYLSDFPDHVRQLWRKDLFGKGHTDLAVYAALLRNSMIPEDQILEANQYVAASIQGDIPLEADVDRLNQSGFFSALKALAFEQNRIDQFGWGNANAPIIAWYVLRFPLDEEVVTAICACLGTAPYPFAVESALKELLTSNPTKLAEFEAIATRLGKPIPPSFATKTNAS